MHHLPMGTVTLLFTHRYRVDASSSRPDERYLDILVQCRQLLHAMFHQWNGYEESYQGDSFFSSICPRY